MLLFALPYLIYIIKGGLLTKIISFPILEKIDELIDPFFESFSNIKDFREQNEAKYEKKFWG